MLERIKNIGPGAMVAAAFIGPGTVATATMAGASYGYTLLWAVLFAIFATLILQGMTARLGAGAKMGLGQAIRSKIQGKGAFILSASLVISAIFIGNAAYESGNISGAVMGFEALLEEESSFVNYLPVVIGLIAAALLLVGNYKLIERSLMLLVATIGVVFLIAAILLKPDFAAVLNGMFVPRIPEGSALLIIGLIGTTVVPYNLFLHASAAKEKWSGTNDLKAAKMDTIISIVFGGLITMAILVTSAAVLQSTGSSEIEASTLGAQLKPLLGDWSNGFLAIGFLAAGLSSAITAPLAASYAVSELLNWKSNLKELKFRAVWLIIIVCGVLFASVPDWKPSSVILFAQVANGLLLPVIAIFLLYIMNDKKLVRDKLNGTFSNIVGVIVVLITIGIAIKGIASAFGLFD